MKREASIKQSALLVIDVQDSFKGDERWLRRNNPAFEQNIQQVIEEYRSSGLPIFFFLDAEDSGNFSRSSPYFKLMDFIQPGPSEPVIVKTSRNCFTSTNLADRLKAKGVKRVVVTGIKTEQCCETTARVASDLGYEVDFITEATLTFPIPHPNLPEELTADEVVQRTEYSLRNRFAQISTIADLCSELRR
jgi:nicotinamidase-related amidase